MADLGGSGMLEAYSKLSRADQRAIVRRLSSADRAQLDALLKTVRKPNAPKIEPRVQREPKLNLAGHSPWLARRLTALLSGTAQNSPATPAVQRALRSLLLTEERP